jgi:hypothetical protein
MRKKIFSGEKTYLDCVQITKIASYSKKGSKKGLKSLSHSLSFSKSGKKVGA